MPTIDFPFLNTKKNETDYFLLSQLPMTIHPKNLFKISEARNTSNIDLSCAAHDLTLYNVSLNMNKDAFYSKLGNEFNSHPFIVKFKEAIKNSKHINPDRDGSLQFGLVRKWFAENTTTVPTPRPFELNENVKILYEWICYFDKKFTHSVPGAHSQVIKYNGG